MRQLAIIGSERSSAGIVAGTEGTFELEGVPVRFGIVETSDLSFDADAEANADLVFIRVRAFSCNYRDRVLILRMVKSDRRSNYYVIGSEFVGEVIATGRNVTRFEPGDRVIADAAYPHTGVPGVLPGLPTNHGSRELQILHQRKLMRVPEAMPDDIAAGFTIGGQTTFSMIRRLDLKDGENVLVTGAKSNTSLFAISALKNRPVDVYGLSSSDRHSEKLMALGLKELFVVDVSQREWIKDTPLAVRAIEIEGFDAVIDPFSDTHLSKIATLMALEGRLVTCGSSDPYSQIARARSQIASMKPSDIVTPILLKNIAFIGNCLGQTSDLQAALDAWCDGQLTVPVYSCLTPSETETFFSDTYLDPNRFGEVVLRYDP